jgi:hypothetical protein
MSVYAVPVSTSHISRRRRVAPPWPLIVFLSACSLTASLLQAQPCTSNPIVCENALPGSTGWAISASGDPSLQGFAADISVNVGQTVAFKVKTTASNYKLDIYRMGYYGGTGARKVATVEPSVPLPQSQPACLTDAATKLYDCGNWAVSATWQVPSTATSGIYFAALVRADTGGASHIFFIVRNDTSHSDLLFQTADETWQAYNPYGGNSLYGDTGFSLPNRAYKVSYNRPSNTANLETATWIFNAEYPMVRWLEANGYDVSYFTGVDAARTGSLITNHKVYLSVGHDEYWSGPHRASVEAARNAGVNLAFFSGNEVFWKTRWEASIDSSASPYRTLVCYKETLNGTPSGGVPDPADPPTWTGTWRDPRLSPPADGGRPENNLTGTLFMVNGPATDNTNLSILVPAADGKMRFWRNTSIATLPAGQTATLPGGTLGYEWDGDLDNGFRPAGFIPLSSGTYGLTSSLLLDNGATYGSGTVTHRMALYRAPSGALVFGAGTVQWSWGLDSNHDNGNAPADPRMQQATVNLFADMGVQPATIQAGVTPATKSTDLTPPASTIITPTNGSTIPFGASVTISGTAADSGGGTIGGVEVSTDGGQTWHAAAGRQAWSFAWSATAGGPVNIQSRAVDDSGNLEIPTGITVTVAKPLISGDVTVSHDSSTAAPSVASPIFSTVAGGELLLAFVSGDYLGGANTTITGVAGAGLTWTLAVRSNGQSGTAEIWRAFAPTPLSNVTVSATLSQSVVASITVMSFSGVDTSGSNGSGAVGATTVKSAPNGAPAASLVTTRNNSWVFGVGTDYDNPIARTPSAAQSLVHQYLTPPGDTYWVQKMNAPTGSSGTSVTLSDTAPTGDRYDLSLVEVLPAPGGTLTWGISGTISPSLFSGGTLLTLSGSGTGTATANSSGIYSFSGLGNGSYTITPRKSGYTFSPTSQTITLNSASALNINFTVTALPTFSASGNIAPLPGGSGTTLTISGAGTGTTTSDASGNYSFAGLNNGSYNVAPSKTGFTFTPPNQGFTVNGANVTNVNFSATAVQTSSISGTLSPLAGGSGATVSLSGPATLSTAADSNGNYSFAGLVAGTYTVTPTLTGYIYTPPSQPVVLSGANAAGINFSASKAITIDVNTSKDGTGSSTNITSPIFSTTAGNELLLAFVATDYVSGANTSITSVSGGGLTWVLAVRANGQSGTSEIWRTFAPAALNNVSVSATLSQSVLSSITVVSFTGVNTSGTNGAGAIGAIAGKSAASGAPSASLITTANNSWVFGVGNDFDNATARTTATGQSLVHQFLTGTGDTYWVQKLNAAVPLNGTTVNIADTAPTNDRFNLAAVEIVPAVGTAAWSLSGVVSPLPGGAGVSLALSGTQSATTTTDSAGNYSFNRLPNGSYTVTPSKTGVIFNPASQPSTINGANVSAVNFTANSASSAIQLTQATSNGSESTGNSLSVSFAGSNTGGNMLIVTGSAARPASTLTVTDTAGNTYVPAMGPINDPVQNVNVYVWYVPNCKNGPNTVTITPSTPSALEIHISEFSGVDRISPLDQVSTATGNSATVSSGAKTPVANGELIFGYAWVVNIGTAGAGFTTMSTINGDVDEYQVQAAAGNIAATFTQTAAQWLAVMATFKPAGQLTISGTISPGNLGIGTAVTLSGSSSATVNADANGSFSFTGLSDGSYTVTPGKSGIVFSPNSQNVALSGSNFSGVNFTAQGAGTFSISGTISPTLGGGGATVTLSGAAANVTTADPSGNYLFSGLANGNYSVAPSNSGYKFSPVSTPVTLNGANQAGVNFTAQSLGSSWNISGTISPAASGSSTTVSVSGPVNISVIADASGNYTASALVNGSYTLTPAKNGLTFSPAGQTATINNANTAGINFTALAPGNSITLDSNISTDGASSSSTIASPLFSTAAANELLLAFIATDYLGGSNTTVNAVSGGALTWVLVARANGQTGTSEIWRAFAPSALSNAKVTATLSQSVISSLTVMSFAGINPSGTNGSGAIGATSTSNAASGAPTTSLTTTGNNSWVVGVGNDYDNAIARTVGPGQSLVHQYLTPTGDTYWVQKRSAPTPVSGTHVTINDTAPVTDRYNLNIVEILAGSAGPADTTPPTVSMISPAPGAPIANLATVAAQAMDDTGVAGVQFFLDGSPLGSEVTVPPFSMTWNTATATNGAHTLTGHARDSAGLTATSNGVTVTVDNSGSPAVVGNWSPVVNLPAVAVNLVLLQNNKVLFYQDGATPTIWDYSLNTFTNVPVGVELFCSGHALLKDGRILVVGGFGGSGSAIGIANAEIFDPFNNTWKSVPNMAYKRWYPTATTLSDGRILVTAGWQTSAHTNAGVSEIYDSVSNTWTQLTNANNPFETYPFLYQLGDGRIIHVGGSEYATDTDVLDLNTKTWSVVDGSIVDGGSATMYAPGKFLKAGSAADSQTVGLSSNTAFVLDMSQSGPAWRQTPSMAYPRSFLNLTMLPDGNVLATGGETDKNGGDVANAVYAAELWSPGTQTWSTMAAMYTPREYHGTALLLPDGRVMVSGMGADFGNVPDQKNAEFYSPPYLFKGSRPVITQSPANAAYGSTFFVATPDAANITSVVLIRTGAVTHFFDQNERYVPLNFTATSGGLNVSGPANANLAPPGYYMLFIVNSAGVPSVAPFIQLP